MNIEELKRLAELNAGWSNASSAWNDMINEGGAVVGRIGGAVVGHIDEDGNKYDVAVVDLVQYDGFEGDSLQLAKFYAAANPAVVLELIRQRDELLSALKEARELVDDWGAYASNYMQEKHDLEGDLSRLDAVISKMETP